jgi:hypothetical protein
MYNADHSLGTDRNEVVSLYQNGMYNADHSLGIQIGMKSCHCIKTVCTMLITRWEYR